MPCAHLHNCTSQSLVVVSLHSYETLQPRWNDQTCVIPVDYEQFHNLKSYEVSHKEFLRIEVFARLMINRTRLLGHATIEKTELSRLAKAVSIAVASVWCTNLECDIVSSRSFQKPSQNDEKIVRLPITFKTTRGALGVR